MSTVLPGHAGTHSQAHDSTFCTSAYGYFAEGGAEYRITDHRTPSPWSNIIANRRLGMAISQTGSGFSWIDNSQLAVLTRWQQEFAHDASGKFLYLRDAVSGEIWSLSPAPVFAKLDQYECRHGMGYTTFVTEFSGIRAEWTLFVAEDAPVELWRVALTNLTDRARSLELTSYLEWNCGVSPAPRREFQKLFLETAYDAERGIHSARSHMWDVPGKQYGHWNETFPYVAAFAASEPVIAAQGDKYAFLGHDGGLASPIGVRENQWKPRFGRHNDPIAASKSAIELRPNGTMVVGFALGAAADERDVKELVAAAAQPEAIETALSAVREGWRARLAAHRVDTPDDSINALTNDWLRYQAISSRIWGRCGYYQQSGAYGFRDQLQDSQVWLTIDPAECRKQIRLHAAHQFADGSVYHWWHPLSEQGLITTMTDDLLWLAFVTASYIRETGDLRVLDDVAPFLDDEQPAPIREHVRRAFERVFRRTSERGLPFIGAGDWNDGLSAAGMQERGESVWLGHFLAGLLRDWAEIYDRIGEASDAGAFREKREALVAAINTHAWDGDWYIRATLDDGSKLGAAECRVGRIFLNAQTWAVLNDVAPEDRRAACMDAVRKHLISSAGALLLAPAFDEPRAEVGYITRYAPGLRENGGVYTHAATWAIAAACKIGDAKLAGELLAAMNPANKDATTYRAEPYVTPGNVDGPDSPYHGRAGWTWYTGSASWLHRVICEWVLGVRPEWDGLRVAPCLPPDWSEASMVRPYRGNTYEIRIKRVAAGANGHAKLMLDGKPVQGNLIPNPETTGQQHVIEAHIA